MATHVVPTVDEQRVRSVIDRFIDDLDERMKCAARGNDEMVVQYGFAIDTLIRLEHELRICGCEPEAYEKRGEG